MADLEHEEQSSKPAKAPRPKPQLPKVGGGGGNIGMIVGWALALAALGAAGFLFTQVSALKKTVAENAGPLPRGAAEGAAEAEATEAANVDDWQEDAQQVTYELGKFTTNTADGRHAQLSIALRLESYYRQEEWDAYAGQQRAYDEQMKAYLEQQKGLGQTEEGKGKGKEGEQARAKPAYTPAAMHSAPKEEAKPLEKPVEPERPLTRLERALMEDDAMVRDTFIKQINATASSDFISETGKAAFKQAVIDALNAELPSHAGTILDIYFKDLVTT
jgi:flagellar basal body-associated protein FliL